MKATLVRQMQRFVAESCIGASVLRNQGGSGLLNKARLHFKALDLSAIPTTPKRFSAWLDKQTELPRRSFPRGARRFGTARKALNLFLRSAAYNVVLNEAYRLDRLLPALEVPLDSYAASHLQTYDRSLPKQWSRLKSITARDHRSYQGSALALAKRWSVHRVDLDTFFYREKAGVR